MPSAISPNPRAGSAQPDELDRLLDYDDAVEDFLNDVPIRGNDTATAEQPPRDEDQEVQVKKKRAPVPKLDENRLLSDAGIPKLRKITKKSLKFRGKGHEFSDISRLLNTYQLWLDDLYPRAKFKDALAMVEKVGHSKRMQITRRAWLDETKPNRGNSPDPDVQMSGGNGNSGDDQAGGGDDATSGETPAQPTSKPGETNQRADSDINAPPDDELDALMAENTTGSTAPKKRKGPFEDDEEPDEDELDALMEEGNAPTLDKPVAKATQSIPFTEQSDDELDALMAEQNDRASADQSRTPAAKQRYEDFADDEEAMAEMGW